MEKLGRRRKLEVRGGSGHHLPTSNVQQPHQADPDPTQARASPGRAEARIPSGTFYTAKSEVALFGREKILKTFPNGLGRVSIRLVGLLHV